MLPYLLALVGLILLFFLYRYLPNKKIFACFCLTLILAGGIAYVFHPTPKPVAISEEERQHRAEQQQLFALWYASYQKNLTDLDRNWQWYHNILENFKEDNIGIETTYSRLKQLDQDSLALKNRIAETVPPKALDDGYYDLVTAIMNKTNIYAEAQARTITLTKEAADPKNISEKKQEEQSKLLQNIMLRESPSGLYTAKEITAIRDDLDIKDTPSDSEK